MAVRVDPAPEIRSEPPGARRPPDRRTVLKVVIAGAVAVAAVVFFLVTATRGPAGDPRIENPNPGPSPEPFLGVDNWPTIFSLLFVIVAVLVMAPLVWRSIRNRKLDHALIVFLAVAVLAWMDPPANWVTYTVYDPDFLHFPTTWAWMRLSPSVEPLMVIPGYPFYYFTIALISITAFGRGLLPRLQPRSWLARHPRTGAFLAGFVIAILWDIPTELFMIRAHMYIYSQRFGPEIGIGSHAGLPIIWSFFTVFSIAVIASLLWRDDSGRSTVTRVARRLPRVLGGAQRESSARQFIAALLVLSAAYLVPLGLYFGIRVSGLADRPFKGDWPYPEIKVYDPQGVLEDHGIPGPYYR